MTSSSGLECHAILATGGACPWTPAGLKALFTSMAFLA